MNPALMDEAVRLLAATGDLDRVAAQHRRRPDGRCTACGPRVEWPCLCHIVADRALALRASRADGSPPASTAPSARATTS